MLHLKTIIQRPDAKLFDISNVIKADQYETWHQKFVDKLGTLTVLKSLANARSFETIKDWGEKLISEHKPANLLQLPPFIEKALSQPATLVQQPKAQPTPKPADMRPNTRTSDASPAVTAKPAEVDAVGSNMTGICSTRCEATALQPLWQQDYLRGG